MVQTYSPSTRDPFTPYDRERDHDGGYRGRPPVKRVGSIGVLLGVAAIVVGAMGAAYAWSSTRAKTYEARAEVAYDISDSSSVDIANRELATATVMARSRPLLASVADRLDVPVNELVRSSNAGVVGDSSVIRITVRRSDPEQARRLAQALADGWTREVEESVRERSEQARDFLEDQIEQRTARAAELDERLAELAAAQGSQGAATTSEQATLSTTADRLRAEIATLSDRLVDVRLQQESASPGTITAPAYALDAPVSPRPVQAVAIGALAGLLVASVFVAFVWQRRQHPD